MKNPVSSRMGNTRFTAGPANEISARCQRGLLISSPGAPVPRACSAPRTSAALDVASWRDALPCSACLAWPERMRFQSRSNAAEVRGVEQARGTGAPGELMSKPRWQRALISIAGPAVNLVFPILLLTGFFLAAGVPYAAYYDKPVQIVALAPNSTGEHNPLEIGDRVLSVNGTPTPDWEQAFKALKQVTAPGSLKVVVENRGVQRTVEVPVKNPATADLAFGYPPLPPVIDQVQGDTPAAHAGLREDDRVVGVDGQSIQYWGQFVDYVRGSNGKPITLDVLRKGQVIHTTVTPKMGLNEDGESVYQIGIMRREQTSYRRVSFGESLSVANSFTWDTVGRTVDVVGKLFTGRVSISQLQG